MASRLPSNRQNESQISQTAEERKEHNSSQGLEAKQGSERQRPDDSFGITLGDKVALAEIHPANELA